MQPLLLLALAIGVDVPVHVQAAVSPSVVEQALVEVDRLFEDGGIAFRWRLAPVASEGGTPVTVVVAPRPLVRVITGCRRHLHDHRLGRTDLAKRRITIWSEQVARAVRGAWDEDEPLDVDEALLAKALGRVLAHELGHLFLRLDGHRDDGLMKASFSYRSLRGKNDRPFRLSERDMERVRARVALLAEKPRR